MRRSLDRAAVDAYPPDPAGDNRGGGLHRQGLTMRPPRSAPCLLARRLDRRIEREAGWSGRRCRNCLTTSPIFLRRRQLDLAVGRLSPPPCAHGVGELSCRPISLIEAQPHRRTAAVLTSKRPLPASETVSALGGLARRFDSWWSTPRLRAVVDRLQRAAHLAAKRQIAARPWRAAYRARPSVALFEPALLRRPRVPTQPPLHRLVDDRDHPPLPELTSCWWACPAAAW